MGIPELLAPAGDMAALHAAVNAGADAVYLGYSSFGARASAVNFDEEALREAVRYAHFYHCRVYVTVNTLIKPEEFRAVTQALKNISVCKADAVIVQDLGVAALVRDTFPSLRLHSSTQMAVCSASGALSMKSLGFERVIPARECTLCEIQKICDLGIETEIFVHGALCSAVSGRCLMSSMAGGRSGNRGRCAQPCRQEFCLGRDTKGALLSLRDLCLLDKLAEIRDAGVCSLKIEGRLKSPEYVAVVTGEYRRALDALASGKSSNIPRGMENLRQIFNRGGFTRGHAFGCEDAGLVTGNHVSHEGVPLGKVISVKNHLARIALSHSLCNDDSLQVHGKSDVDIRYSGPDCKEGQEATVYLREAETIAPGAEVSLLSSAVQLSKARSVKAKPVSVTAHAVFKKGKPSEMALSDGTSSVTVTGFVPDAATTRPSAKEDAERQLSKFGDTPFVLDKKGLSVDMEEDLFLPIGAMNALRRTACAALEEARADAFELPSVPRESFRQASHPVLHPSKLRFAVISSQVEIGAKLGENVTFVLAPHRFTAEALEEQLIQNVMPLWLRLPPQLSERCIREILPVINRRKTKLQGLWLESSSHLQLFPDFPIIAGEGIPATNPKALQILEGAGLSAFCLWPEWTGKERFPLGNTPAFLKVYGRQIVMLLNHCPERVRLGLDRNRAECRLCHGEGWTCGRQNAVLRDRKGYCFPLMRTVYPEGCEIEVLGALPTDLSAYRKEWDGLLPLLHFTVESEEQQLSIIRYFESLLRGENAPNPVEKSTSGHWVHGVE